MGSNIASLWGGLDIQLRRSKLDIVLSVLAAVREGNDKPTRIMYSTNLSWRPMRRILESLVNQGLLAEFENEGSRRSKKIYEITEKGLGVLMYFEGASELIDVEEIIS